MILLSAHSTPGIIPNHPDMEGATAIPILQMRKLKHGAASSPARGHMTGTLQESNPFSYQCGVLTNCLAS